MIDLPSDNKVRMNTTAKFAFGERVIHAGRPEWGMGTVTATQPMLYDGKPCQRVTIRFERAGLKTLSTAIAELQRASEASPDSGDPGESKAGFIAQIETEGPEKIMQRLPESCRDPFLSLEKRLINTLNLYKYTPEGASLLDWAAAQSGLADPLVRFNRHELELLFRRFEINRDDHLRKLAQELKRADAEALARVVRSAPASARNALRRADVLR